MADKSKELNPEIIPANVKLANSLRQTVLRDEVLKLYFQADGYWVAPQDFRLLSNEIATAAVSVEHNKKKPAYKGEYIIKKNLFVFGMTHASTPQERSLMIHEITHRIFDRKKIRLTRTISESLAYIAQCTFCRAEIKQSGHPYMGSSNMRSIFGWAWNIAGNIIEGQAYSEEDYENLKKSVSNSPLYRDRLKEDVIGDG